MNDTDQNWIREGARVFVDGRHGVTRSLITRLTKTQIVLENGAKFNRRTLRPVGEGSPWDIARLVSADDPATQARELLQRRDKAGWMVQHRAEEFRKSPGEASVAALEAAIARWRSLNDEVPS